MTPVQPPQASVMSPTCPLCHTLDHTVTADSLRAGAEWACTRCGQTWSAARLATAAAYEQYQSPR
jgi:transposase-like protein